MTQPCVREAQPVRLAGEPEQHLCDRQADQLGVGQQRWPTQPPAVGQQVVDGDVQCGDEVVKTGVHEVLRVDVAVATPSLDGLASFTPQPTPTTPTTLETIIWGSSVVEIFTVVTSFLTAQ